MSQPLHPVERALLRPFLTREDPGSFLSSDDLGPLSGLSPAQVQMGLEMVKSRGLIEERLDREETLLRPTDQGLAALAEGLPEEIIMEALAAGPRPMSDLRGLFPDPSVASKAMGALKDAGSLKVEGGQAVRAGDLPPGVLLLKKLLRMSAEAPVILESLPKEEQELLSQYQRRRGKEKGLIRLDVRSFRSYRLSPEAGLTPSDLESGGELLGNVTPEMLQSRSWEGGTFRPFSVGADAPPPPAGPPASLPGVPRGGPGTSCPAGLCRDDREPGGAGILEYGRPVYPPDPPRPEHPRHLSDLRAPSGDGFPRMAHGGRGEDA